MDDEQLEWEILRGIQEALYLNGVDSTVKRYEGKYPENRPYLIVGKGVSKISVWFDGGTTYINIYSKYTKFQTVDMSDPASIRKLARALEFLSRR